VLCETPRSQKNNFCVRFVTKMSAENRSKLRELMMRVEMITRFRTVKVRSVAMLELQKIY
jgi:hypothetical protein